MAMPNKTPEGTEGKIAFHRNGEDFETWFRAFGNIKEPSSVPLIVLHGGPGLSHDYLLPLVDLSTSRPVIFYDQIGNARSTRLPDKDKSFWNVDLFIDELENLINHFKFQDRFDLIGHSWGGMLAFEFDLRRKPAGLRYIIATNTLASMAAWHQSNQQLAKQFPQWVQDGLAIGLKDPKAAGPALLEFRKKHGCRLSPFPEEYVRTQMYVIGEGADTTVLKSMSAGVLSNWNIESELKNIRVPVLLINGRYDVSQDFVNVPIFKNVPKVKWITFENSSHTPFWEEREKYMEILNTLLDM